MAIRSLRLRLLGWLLLPLALIVVVNTWVTYRNAQVTAGLVTDRVLLASARSMAEQTRMIDGAMNAMIPPSALEMFASTDADRVYYRIMDAGSRPARLIAGYPDLPDPPAATDQFTPRYYDADYRGRRLRLVGLQQPVPDPLGLQLAVVTVGETLNARSRMVKDLWIRGFGQQLLLVAIAGLCAWLGLKRELGPLLRLRDEVVERRPDELKPFSGAFLQAELVPFVAALNRYMERLRHQIEAQRRFIADAAHQLRTPLTLLSTQAGFALRANHPSEKNEAIQAIEGNARQMTRLANQLLTLSRAEPSARPPVRDPVDLVATARRALESLVDLALARDIDLGFEPQVETATVLGESTLLQEMIVNLVDNALRYAPRGGIVTLGIAPDGANWQLTVRDNGPGIPIAERERVFERFYRVLGTTAEGSGLGLAIAKEIVESCGGRVTLEDSLDGPGLLAVVRLPAASSQ
jgi:two-component system, OmpR family, sensor histidine kinase TctE